MKAFKSILFFVLFTVMFSFIACDNLNSPNHVTVTFELNGGKVNSSESNQAREGTEGKYFKLPQPEYITGKEYDSTSQKTEVFGRKFEGWILKGTSTIIYNEYDSYGAFPDEDKTYVAKWGTEGLLYQEAGDTTN